MELKPAGHQCLLWPGVVLGAAMRTVVAEGVVAWLEGAVITPRDARAVPQSTTALAVTLGRVGASSRASLVIFGRSGIDFSPP